MPLFLGVVSILLGPLFLLELVLCSSPVAYWTPTDLGSSSFSVISFCFFILLHWVLKTRMLKWFAIPFSSGPFLSELSTMTCPSSPGHLSNPGIKLMSSALVGGFFFFFTTEPPGYSLFPCGQVLICTLLFLKIYGFLCMLIYVFIKVSQTLFILNLFIF